MILGRQIGRSRRVEKLFIDLCIEKANTRGKNGSSLNVISWDIVRSKIEEQKGVILSRRHLKNHWNYMKRKYTIWINIMESLGMGMPQSRTPSIRACYSGTSTERFNTVFVCYDFV